MDVILIDGHKLYSRQGTAFNVRLILIDGRKVTPSGYVPLFNKNTDKVIDSFEGLYDRISTYFGSDNDLMDMEAEALMLELELLHLN
jgi:hypothetical protein